MTNELLCPACNKEGNLIENQLLKLFLCEKLFLCDNINCRVRRYVEKSIGDGFEK